MRRALPLVLLLGCSGSSTEPPAEPATVSKAAEPAAVSKADPPAPAAEDPISADDLRAHVSFLASDEMGGRPTPSPQLDAAARYIETRFEEIGLRPPPEAGSFRQTFECGRSPGDASNVIGWLPGQGDDETAIIVSAHYDHLGPRGTDHGEDRIRNGANDNASGVAAVLEIAERLATRETPPRRSVLFVAFCGEELGLRGSRHLAGHPVWPPEKVAAMLNLEMLGRADPSAAAVSWVTGSELSDLTDMLMRVPQTGISFVPSSEIGPAEARTFRRSDNLPLAEEGIVAHTLSTGRIGPLYHSVDDEVDTMNFATMQTLVRGIATAVEWLADTEEVPQWSPEGNDAGFSRR